MAKAVLPFAEATLFDLASRIFGECRFVCIHHREITAKVREEKISYLHSMPELWPSLRKTPSPPILLMPDTRCLHGLCFRPVIVKSVMEANGLFRLVLHAFLRLSHLRCYVRFDVRVFSKCNFLGPIAC